MSDHNGRIAGWVLIATALLAVLAMLHHPVGGGGTPEEAADSIARIAGPARLVHGAMIGVAVVLLYALSAFALKRGVSRPLVLAGLVAYGAGTLAMLPAPVLDGFVAPDLAERALGDSERLALFKPHLSLVFSIAIAFAKLATILMSLGVLLFSLDLIGAPGLGGWMGRGVGVLGAAVGAAAAGAVITGALQLNAHGMTAVVAAWGLWFAALGALLAAGKT